MDTDLDDIQKLQSALSAPRDKDESTINEASCPSESGDGFTYQTYENSQGDASFCIFEELSNDSRDDEDQLIIDEMDPSIDNTLVLNKAYQTLLMELLQKLEVLKFVNQNRQRLITNEIEELTRLIKQKKKKAQKKKIKIPFTFFGTPYFKDNSYNCPPKNDDAKLAEKIGFRSVVAISQNKLFSKYEIRRLLLGLRGQALTIQATKLMKKRAELQNQLKRRDSTSISASERNTITRELETVQRQIFEVSEWSDEKLLDIDPAQVDWQKIAIENFERSRNPDQIRLYFTHHMHPNVNKQLWGREEIKRLKDLTKEYDNGFDWDDLAKRLATGRTPYECFRQFQERFNTQHRKFGWDENDNRKLINLLSQYGDKSSREIDWDEVKLHFPGRSKSQLYAHFRYYLQASGDRFTNSEDTLLLEGIQMGFKIADIALLLGKRTVLELSYRYKVLKKDGRSCDPPWTEEEDKLLLERSDFSDFVSKGARRFLLPRRTLAQVFSRYHFLRMKMTSAREYVKMLKAKMQSKYSTSWKRYRVMKLPSATRPKINCKAPLKSSIIPKLKKGLVGRKPIKADELHPGNKIIPLIYTRQKGIAGKLKDLKEILRPYMNVYTKRVRTNTYAGDGREGGLILACLYRILRGNFTLAPREDPSEEEMEAFGVDEHTYSAYQNLIMIMKEMQAPAIEPGKIVCIPPTLTTLTGFRGLLLHRKYIISSAKQEYTPPEASQARIVEIEDSESRPGSSSPLDGTEMEVETTQQTNESCHLEIEDAESRPKSSSQLEGVEMEVETAQQTIKGCQLPNQEEAVAMTPEPSASIDSQLISKERECLGATVNHENHSSIASILPDNGCENSAAILPDKESENVIEILPDSSRQTEYILEPDDSLFEEAQEFFNRLTESDTESEFEDDDYVQPEFGNKEADGLLFSRLLSLFYWPGIMSTVNVTEDMKRAAEQTSPEPEPEPTPELNPRLRKFQLRQIRREHIRNVVRRRYGKCKEAPPASAATTSADPSAPVAPSTSAKSAAESDPKPPPAKKPRQRKATAPAVPAPTVERITRSRSKSAAGN